MEAGWLWGLARKKGGKENGFKDSKTQVSERGERQKSVFLVQETSDSYN